MFSNFESSELPEIINGEYRAKSIKKECFGQNRDEYLISNFKEISKKPTQKKLMRCFKSDENDESDEDDDKQKEFKVKYSVFDISLNNLLIKI